MGIAVTGRRADPPGGDGGASPPPSATADAGGGQVGRPDNAPPAQWASSPPTSASDLRGLSLEWTVLLACARLRLDADSVATIRAALQKGIDWDRLYRLASRHRLLQFVYRHLNTLEPGAIPIAFRQTALAHTRYALQRAGEVLQLIHAFESAGILAVPYKGPALSVQLYGDATLRTSRDLDVLVRRQDALRAHVLLVKLGYRPETPQGEAEEAFRLRSRYSETFLKDGSFRVELHWAFTNQDVGFPLELNALLPRLERIALGGGEVPTFGAEDLLLILCVHGAKHRWNRLEWITGVAELVRASSLDWERLLGRARKLGSLRMLLLGIALAHDVFDVELPDEVLHGLRSDRYLPWLKSQVWSALADEAVEIADSDRLSIDLFRFRLRERVGGRIRFALYRLTTPSDPAAWRVVSIGRWSFPIHALVRPIQLIGKLATMPGGGPGRSRARRR
jgi:hypothetical protein